MKVLLGLVVVSLFSTNAVLADTLEDRVTLLEQKVEALQKSVLPKMCLSQVDGYVAPGAVPQTRTFQGDYINSSFAYSRSFEFKGIKEFTSKSSTPLVLIAVNDRTCSVLVVRKSDLIYLTR